MLWKEQLQERCWWQDKYGLWKVRKDLWQGLRQALHQTVKRQREWRQEKLRRWRMWRVLQTCRQQAKLGWKEQLQEWHRTNCRQRGWQQIAQQQQQQQPVRPALVPLHRAAEVRNP